jgi:hypothetical protein
MAQETIDVEALCNGDRELAEALKRVLFLSPGRISTSIDDLAGFANRLEQKGEKLLSRVNYETAGRLALMKGDADIVRRYFSKSAELEVDERLRNVFATLASKSKEAVNAANEYYQKIQADSQSRIPRFQSKHLKTESRYKQHDHSRYLHRRFSILQPLIHYRNANDDHRQNEYLTVNAA